MAGGRVEFTDGKAMTGELLQKVTNNRQIPWNHPAMTKISGLVMQALGAATRS